jgi:hypothetical protein
MTDRELTRSLLLFFFVFTHCYTLNGNDNTVNLQVPKNIWIDYAEKSLAVNWDSVAGAIGYNVYQSFDRDAGKKEMQILNRKLITSGPRFVFIWSFDNGERERAIKGYKHFLSVAAVFAVDGDTVESNLSEKLTNNYFEGFSNITSEESIRKIIIHKQKADSLPIQISNNRINTFIQFMDGPGRYLTELLRDSLNFQEIGACDPVSTIALNLLKDWDLYAYKAEGVFIEEFHTFIVITINHVDYILDFTADQFIPGVSPVLVPRDKCYINKNGRLNLTGKPVYQIGRLSRPGNSKLNNSERSQVYHTIYRMVAEKYGGGRD